MKKKNVIITSAVLFVTIILTILADFLKMHNLQFWKGGLIIASLGLTFINSVKDGDVIVKKSAILHIFSGFMLGVSLMLFVGMYLNLI